MESLGGFTKLTHPLHGVLAWWCGASKAEHDRNLEAALRCIQSAGITLNKDKCEFGKETIKFLSHVINAEGVSPDPQKTAVIRNMKEPSNVSK